MLTCLGTETSRYLAKYYSEGISEGLPDETSIQICKSVHVNYPVAGVLCSLRSEGTTTSLMAYCISSNWVLVLCAFKLILELEYHWVSWVSSLYTADLGIFSRLQIVLAKKKKIVLASLVAQQ